MKNVFDIPMEKTKYPPNRIKEFREKLGISQVELAASIGTYQERLGRIERSEQKMDLDTLIKVTAALNCNASDLIIGTDSSVFNLETEVSILPKQKPHPAPISVRGKDMIPIWSGALGSETDIVHADLFLPDAPIGYRPRPEILDNIDGAYMLLMMGDSMIPRYWPKQILHIDPHKEPCLGNGVVVRLAHGAVIIKELVKCNKDELILRQYSPNQQDFSVKKSDIISIHTIVGLDEYMR